MIGPRAEATTPRFFSAASTRCGSGTLMVVVGPFLVMSFGDVVTSPLFSTSWMV